MMLRMLWVGLILVGTSTGPPQPATVAFLTSASSSTSNQFSVGTLHIAQNVAAGTTLSMSDLLAGDDFDAQLDVANSGSLALVYSVTSAVSGDVMLASTLQLTVRAKSTNPCSARDGSVLYSGALSTAAVGDPTHGAQAGDRTLSNGAGESLCFTVALPASATSSVAGKSVSATFSFVAEQS